MFCSLLVLFRGRVEVMVADGGEWMGVWLCVFEFVDGFVLLLYERLMMCMWWLCSANWEKRV